MDTETKMIPRDRPEPEESRAALVKRWQDDVIQAKRHWKKDFDRMRRAMDFARSKQWPGQSEEDDRYTANLVQRVLKTTVASLYAKNPTAVAAKRKRLDFVLWDGKIESAMGAMQAVQNATPGGVDPVTGQAVQPTDPAMLMQALALIQDIMQGVQRREMMDKVGETLICLLEYFIDDSRPTFKGQMKRVVRRARTSGVGYVKLGFQRAMELSTGQEEKLNEYAERLAMIGRIRADIADGEVDPYCAEVEELKLAAEAIRQEPEVLVREGVVFSYPHSTRIIPSITTESLTEWIGSDWIAEEVMLSPDRVKERYGVDVGANYTAYRVLDGQPVGTGEVRRIADRKNGLACVWHIYDKASGLELVVAEGYPDFLQPPTPQKILIEQFFPVFAITFNDTEHEGELFPLSDVDLIRHQQLEYNRAHEARRQHRIAARPLYLSPKGVFEEDETKSLAAHEAHEVIELNALDKGMKAEDLIMPVKKLGVDPNLYETETIFNDIQRITGNQESILGGVSSGTATAQNLAEAGRQGTLGLDGDNLDDMLSLLFRATGQLLLTELDETTVKQLVGPGAVWPTMSRQEIMSELWLSVKAGSSGRPDAAREAANFERIYPLLLQVPGIKPDWLAERAVRIADDSTDLTDAFQAGLPSILTLNKTQQASTGDPASDPNAQGEEGGDKNRAPTPDGQDTNSFPGAGAGSALQ